MKTSESIKNIAGALMEFQSKMIGIPKDGKNPHFGNTYTSLSTIINTIRKPLADAGLTFTQLPTGEDGLTTILMHPESGEFIETELRMRPTKDDPQGRGSALTYMRRYSLSAILGLNEEDDDAQEASKPTAGKKNSKKKELPWLNTGSDAWMRAVKALHDGKELDFVIGELTKRYRINKDDQAELERIFNEDVIENVL